MKKLRFLSALILAICLLMGLATACTKTPDQPEKTSQTDPAEAPSSETPSGSAEVPTKKPTEDETKTPTEKPAEKPTDESVSEIPGIELPAIWEKDEP